MTRVASATATEFTEFQPVRSRLLVFGRNVITTLTVLTLKYDVVAWHNLSPGLWSLAFGLGSDPTKT